MATRLHDFVELVEAKLTDAGVTDVEMRVGRKAMSFHGQKRKVCWLTPGGKLSQPQQAGGRLNAAGQRVVLCKMREADVYAYVYGGSDEATEELLDALVAAICNIGEANIPMPAYEWVTQEEQKAGNVDRTELIRLRLTLRLPVAAEISPLRAITGVDDVCGVIGDDDAQGNWTIVPHG